jgi:putative ABC transport system permease protein
MNAQRATLGAIRAASAVLTRNRWRSALTLTVCGLGTAGVIVAGAIGNAQVIEMQKRLDAVGGRLVVITPNTVPPYPGRARQLDHFISLEPADVSAIRDEIPGVEAIVPAVARNTTLRRDRNASRVRLVGTTAEYARLRRFAPARGRFLRLDDASERVVVLGQAASRELGGVRPGDVVWLAGQPYETVGILEPLGVNFAGEDEDHQAFIPLEAYMSRIANRPWVSYVYLQVDAAADSTDIIQRVQQLLRARHNRRGGEVDDAIARDMAEVAAQQSSIATTAVWIVSVISGLLLALGIVGIATLMVQTVRQRRAEIGVRRAVGATPFNIALQLFMESMAVTGVGVVVGLLVGLAGAWIGQMLWGPIVTLNLQLVLATAISSMAVSGVASLVPATIAGRLEPAAALRL